MSHGIRRDEFAKAALTGIIANATIMVDCKTVATQTDKDIYKIAAEMAVRFADETLKALRDG